MWPDRVSNPEPLTYESAFSNENISFDTLLEPSHLFEEVRRLIAKSNISWDGWSPDS